MTPLDNRLTTLSIVINIMNIEYILSKKYIGPNGLLLFVESLGDPYFIQVPLPRIPVSRKLRSTQYPKDTFPAKLTVKPQRITHRAAARLNGPAARLTRRTHVFRQLGNIPVQ